jgi:hypothetical protein
LSDSPHTPFENAASRGLPRTLVPLRVLIAECHGLRGTAYLSQTIEALNRAGLRSTAYLSSRGTVGDIAVWKA